VNPNESRQLFFVRLDYESSQNVFNNYKINSVPVIFYISSSDTKMSDNFVYDVNPRDQFHAGTFSPSLIVTQSLTNVPIYYR